MVSDGSLFCHNNSGEAHNWYQFGRSLFGHSSSGEAHNWYQSGGPLFGHNSSGEARNWYLADLYSVTTILERYNYMERAVHWCSWYLMDTFFLPQQFYRSMQSVVHCSSWYPMIFFFGHNSGKARNWYLADLCSVATVLGKDAIHCSSCYM